MSSPATSIEELPNQEYKWGFVTEINADKIPKGVSEDLIRIISAKKNEPGFMLESRLKSYRQWLTMEGCTAPMRDKNQLHTAVVELVALDNSQIKYSTVQTWRPGGKEGKGGIYNLVTKSGRLRSQKWGIRF